MPEDPNSWYCWWAPIKELGLRRLMRDMMPKNLTPSQKRRRIWFIVLFVLAEVLLAIYLWIVLSRTLGL